MHLTAQRPLASLDNVRSAHAGARLTLLGGFSLERFSRPIRLSEAAQRLLAFLALHARPVPRQRLAGTFWPDTSDERAMGNLRTTLWRLNRPSARFVAADGDRVSLATDVVVDVQRLTISARAILEDPSTVEPGRAEDLAEAGDLLPDWSEDWVLPERERFRQLRLHALERLSGELVESGRYGRAVELCLVAVATEPLRESAQRQLVRAHLAEGNVTEAVRQYEAYRVLLLDELGVEPSSAMTDLLADAGLRVPMPLGPKRSDRRTRLSPERPPIVGRR